MSSPVHHLSHPKYRRDMDGLRAVAVLPVVVFHAFPGWLPGGFTGVDVFFVISGFLISTIIFENLDRGTFSFAEFYVRRIKRIFPALLLVLATSFAFGWFGLFSEEYQQLGKHMAAGAGFISNLVLWQESGYFDAAADTKPLLHLWSLGIEEQFYIAWPLTLWVAWKRKFNLLILTILVATVSFYLNVTGVKQHAVAAFYSPQTRCWELLSGSLLAWLTIYRKDAVSTMGARLSNVLGAMGALLLVYGFLCIKADSFPGVWAAVPVTGAIACISAGPKAWVNRTVLSNRIAVQIGLISFPLYLWHWPLLSFARIVEGEFPSRYVRAAAVILSIVLAALTYELVEKNVRPAGHDKLKAGALVLLMALVGFVGLNTYREDGLPSRSYVGSFSNPQADLAFTQDLGRPAAATIMLLGDSHAARLVPGLKRVMGDSVADYTSAGCIPFHDVDRYDHRFVPGSCLKSMNAALAKLEQSREMTGIIVTSMGPIYLTGEAFKGMDPARVAGLGVVLASHPEIKDRWQIYAYGLRNTLERLSAANKNVLFVIDVPELDFNPRSCIAGRPLAPMGKKAGACAVSRLEYDKRSQRYKELVHSIVKDFPRVKVYDPTDDFCDEKLCWAMRDGRLLYHDADHLSDAGSNYLVERMAPLLKGPMSLAVEAGAK